MFLAPVWDVTIVERTLLFADPHNLALLRFKHLRSVFLVPIDIGSDPDLVLILVVHGLCSLTERPVVGVVEVENIREDIEVL